MKLFTRILLCLVLMATLPLRAASGNSYQELIEAGFAATDENRFADAIDHLVPALDLIPADSTDILDDIYNSLLVCYMRLGQSDEALKYGKKTLEIDEKSGILEDLSSTLNNLAAICLATKRYEIVMI